MRKCSFVRLFTRPPPPPIPFLDTHSRRRYRDIYAQWPIITSIIEFYGTMTPRLQPIAGPGQWNDADQLVIGDHHPQVGFWICFGDEVIIPGAQRFQLRN